jgi:cytochrome c5
MTKTAKIFMLIFLISGAVGFVVSLYIHRPAKPLPPASDVLQTFHYPATFVKQLLGDPEVGKKIFKEFCGSCHAQHPVINVNAPRIGQHAVWQVRRQRGMDKMLRTTIEGKAAMPARGGCFECNDTQLKSTINYMLDQSK